MADCGLSIVPIFPSLGSCLLFVLKEVFLLFSFISYGDLLVVDVLKSPGSLNRDFLGWVGFFSFSLSFWSDEYGLEFTVPLLVSDFLSEVIKLLTVT